MKNLTGIFRLALTTCLVIALTTKDANAQKIEVRGQLNSGFYSYAGRSTASTTSLNDGESTNNPYGSKSGISYGASFNVKRITRSNLIYGGDIGYEMLRSKVDLDFDDALGGDIVWTFHGRTFLNNGFLNIFPFIGQRIRAGSQMLDITIGSDIGILLSSKENGKATATQQENIELTTSLKRQHLSTDIRPRIQVSTDFDKIGIYIGYSYGLTNYYKDYVGSKYNEVFSRMFRVGLSYRIK